jgi:predicted nucleic acid-binding protein
VKLLLDTNVVSEARRTQCHPNVRAHLDAADDADLVISVVSIGEIAFGIARLELGKRRKKLEEWLAQTEIFFADRILPIDRDIARLWGNITAKAAEQGHTFHASDGLIAATALRHGLKLMTRNLADFAGTGVILVDPWEGI